ncbi:MAG: ECF transporter S component [Clostridioides sp.]|jgi:riboflavin transporter FmnP|nr:ECF transporter S component [Clostridioides sp.]
MNEQNAIKTNLRNEGFSSVENLSKNINKEGSNIQYNSDNKKYSTKKINTKAMILISLLSAISFILMYIETPIPGLFPEFLKIDISDIPAIIGGMSFGPFVGVGIVVIKNVIHLVTASHTGGVGELANILAGGTYVFVICTTFRKSKDNKGLVKGMIFATISMAIVGGLVNYFILLPFYGQIMGLEAIINMGSAINKNITNLFTLVLYIIVPFNILKGTIMSACSLFVYKKMKNLI